MNEDNKDNERDSQEIIDISDEMIGDINYINKEGSEERGDVCIAIYIGLTHLKDLDCM